MPAADGSCPAFGACWGRDLVADGLTHAIEDVWRHGALGRNSIPQPLIRSETSTVHYRPPGSILAKPQRSAFSPGTLHPAAGRVRLSMAARHAVRKLRTSL
jgi:hypothetical protein